MAEIRKHNPDAGEGIARLVREAMGESIRPVEPGSRNQPVEVSDEESDQAMDHTAVTFWDPEAQTFEF